MSYWGSLIKSLTQLEAILSNAAIKDGDVQNQVSVSPMSQSQLMAK